MTIAIKPTASGSTIEQDGSTVLSVESDRSVDIDSGTLHVDATNNRVGVGTTSPSQTFHVFGGQSYVTGSSGAGAYTRWYNNAQTTNDLQIGQGWSSGSDNVGFVLNNANADLLFGTNGSERMRIDTSGHVLFGTTTVAETGLSHVKDPNGVYSIYNTTYSGFTANVFRYNSSSVGSIQIFSTSTSYNTTSDHRLKENNVNITDGITRVKLLNPYRFNFIAEPDRTVDGFYAHEVQSVVPEAISGTHNEVDDDGNPVYQGIDQSKLVPLLTSALKEAITKIEDLETRIQALESN